MPRKGHKEGCQCAICRKVAGKKATSAKVAVAPEPVLGVAVSSLMQGTIFEYEGRTYRKDTQPNSRLTIATPVYKAHYTDIYTPLEGHEEFNPATLVMPK